MFDTPLVSLNTHVAIDLPHGIQLYMKREDTIHPFISGNKYRKLRYIVLEAQRQKHTQLLTFGGAFSNHIAAVASVGKILGFKTIGIIRGEELQAKIVENPTLAYAERCGMVLKCISRSQYRNKMSPRYLQTLNEMFGRFYLIPEGGTHPLAVKGCEEILSDEDTDFDSICCPVGTGGTIAGIINSAGNHQSVLGFPALKDAFLKNDICKFVQNHNWTLTNDYHFGGYAKCPSALIHFINNFKRKTGIPLDPIYTGKMMYGIVELIKTGYFRAHTKILAIHTGGLQGIAGMNLKLEQKRLPKII